MEAAELDKLDLGLDFGELETLDVRGTPIELLRAGSGTPLLFLHGLDGIEGAAAILRELARDHAVIAPSLPGFGASKVPQNCNRADDLGYFMFDLLDALGIDAIDVFGTSFGAWVASEMATKDPGRVTSLTLASPLGLKTADRRDHWVADIFMMSKQELSARMQATEPEGPSLFQMPEPLQRRALRADEALSLFGWSPYMCNPKLADRLHRIACPTTVVWGSEEALANQTYKDHWKAALPQAEHREIAGAGHRSHADKPTELAAMVSQTAKGGRS